MADTLSAACDKCVTDAQINSIAARKITGSVPNADNAATAGNVPGIVTIANGDTGSATKNFVDTTTAQTVGGNKTFNNTMTVNAFSAGSGGLNMNDNIVRLRDSADNNHGMLYNSTVDGPEFRASGGLCWTNGASGATQRMSLSSAGTLTVNGNITSTGTISGTLANNSVGSTQVSDGSLRLIDTAVYSSPIGAAGGTFGTHGCLSFNLAAGTIPVLAADDVVYLIPPASSPTGFYFQPIYVTGSEGFVYNICNTLNTNNTLPAQSYRLFVLRP